MRWNYGDMLMTGRDGPAYGYRSPTLSFDFSSTVLHTQADVQRYAAALVDWSKNHGSVFQGRRHLAAWGSDFQFSDAGVWFQQMDLLLEEINGNASYGARIRYATLAEYFGHLHGVAEQGAVSFPVRRGLDFEVGTSFRSYSTVYC
jgi:hypothetical protein